MQVLFDCKGMIFSLLGSSHLNYSRLFLYNVYNVCCVLIKSQGLTEKFKEKDTVLSGSATFNYENFMLTVLPFLVA